MFKLFIVLKVIKIGAFFLNMVFQTHSADT